MLGDSLTAGGVWDSLDPEALVINQGVTGDGYELVLARLDQAIETRPDLVFLQVGINDLGHVGDLLEIVEGHVEIWSRLREALPGARIVVCSLIPINERKFRKALAGSNQKIRETNKMLAKAAAREGLEFVDLYSPLSGTDQALPSALTFDGLHLTKGGHQIWLDELLSFLRNPSCQPGASPRAASPGLGSGSLE
jgi:lysophospholipase L1-like esterase